MKTQTDEQKGSPEKGTRKRLPRNRKPGAGFEWGEVDNVTQEDMLLPAKKRKGNRRRTERIESTLTVGGPEVDPYAIVPPQPSGAAAETNEDPAIPSYGRMMDGEEDEFSIFLRNAEKADEREREKEQARKKRIAKEGKSQEQAAKTNSAKPQKSAEPDTGKPSKRGKKGQPSRTAGPAEENPSKKPVSQVGENPLADFQRCVANVREYALDRIEQIGYSEKEKEELLASLSVVDRMISLIGILLHPLRTGDRLPEIPVSERAPAAKGKGRPVSSAKKAPKESLPPSQAKSADSEKEPAEPRQQGTADLGQIRAEWTFDGKPLSDAMLTMLNDAHYEKPTPIQMGTIPQILAGKDLMGQSRTGSGKTAAFMIPIIERVEGCDPGDDPVALVVVPTRELAVQIRDETIKLAHNREIAVVACYGGKPIADQIKKMKGGTDIVIGTPGRILDLVKRSALSLMSLKWVVLDEADRMLDIGFRPDIERILRQTPRDRQTLLFSATLAEPVVKLAQRYMTDPETCDFSENDIAADTIEQFYITVDRDRKFEALVHLLQRENPQQAIVFCRTKRGVDKLARGLVKEFKDWRISAIHGDLVQSNRDSIMRSFRDGSVKLLVATDVVGRGIDVSGISHIINYDIPEFCDDYVHRVGRTGRMGREGVAYTLVTSEEGNELTRIEMRINKLLQRTELEGFEAFTRPDDSGKDGEPKERKAVFGKPLHRVRRAL